MAIRTLAAAAFAAGSVASASSAAIISFNDAGLFAQFAANSGASVATEGFDAYNGFAQSYSGVLSGVTWSANAAGGMYASAGVMSTNNPAPMFFSFAGGVTGVGGQFFATDINFNFVPSMIMVGLADGSGFIGLVSSTSQWQGFWSTGPAITSISVQVMGGTPGQDLYPSADSISVAVVPAPGAVALLGVAGLAARRRRR
jgi:MYXO-CTERM domain-containing protein